MSDRVVDGSQSDPIALSVVVLGWNTRELLLGCLESTEKALAVFADASELIVVDNGSSDGSAEAVRRDFPAARLVALDRNYGYAGGMNRGLAASRGRVLLLLNSDARVTGAALARCADFLSKAPDVAALGPQLVHRDGRLQNSVHAFPSWLTELLPIALLELLLPRRYPSKRRPASGPVDVEAALGASLFVSRSALDRVGPLCEDFFFFLEDTDWCWRARRAGFRIVHLPEVRVEHWSGGSSKRRDGALTRIEFHRSLYRFLRRHRGRATLAFVVALRVFKGMGSVLGLCLVAPFSFKLRVRLRERARLLAWHLRGCPADVGVAGIEAPVAVEGRA